MRPNPHIDFMPIRPLTDELFVKLFDIYTRAVTHTCVFEVEGFVNSETIWTETKEDHDWICNNIIPFYNLTMDDIVDLIYTPEDIDAGIAKGRYDSDRSMWKFTNVPAWKPRSLNFTRIKHNSFVGAHTDHECGCKINIPILNMSSSNIHFVKSDERFWYPSPVLLNVNALHSVDGTERISLYTPKERVFFQLCLKQNYDFYQNIVPTPHGW
jgi:hypothetical protein